MPLKNSRFRIIHRTPADPHGVEGYFIHEIYVDPQSRVRGWRAGVSIGSVTVEGLKACMGQVLDAFNHPVIEHRDLSTPGFVISEDPKVVKATVSRDHGQIEKN